MPITINNSNDVDVVIDVTQVLKWNFDDFNGCVFNTWFPFLYLDLCSLIENIVLFEKPKFTHFTDGNDISVLSEKDKFYSDLRNSLKIKNEGFEFKYQFERNNECQYVNFFRSIERLKSFSVVPSSFVSEKFYSDSLTRTNHEIVCNLRNNYQELSDSVVKIRRDIANKYQDYTLLPIPLLPMIAFQRMSSSTTECFFEVLFEMRDEYKALRRKITTLQEILKDPQIPPQKKHNLIKKWENKWLLISNGWKNNLAVAYGISSLFSADYQFNDNTITAGVNLAKLIEWLISTSVNQISNWYLKPIRNDMKNYMRISDEKAMHKVASLFSTSCDLLKIPDFEPFFLCPDKKESRDNTIICAFDIMNGIHEVD